MNTRSAILVAIVFLAVALAACQQSEEPEEIASVEVEVQHEPETIVEEARETTAGMKAELEFRLDQIEREIDELGREIEEQSETAGEKASNALAALDQRVDEARVKIATFDESTEDETARLEAEIEGLLDAIERGYQELKASFGSDTDDSKEQA